MKCLLIWAIGSVDLDDAPVNAGKLENLLVLLLALLRDDDAVVTLFFYGPKCSHSTVRGHMC